MNSRKIDTCDYTIVVPVSRRTSYYHLLQMAETPRVAHQQSLMPEPILPYAHLHQPQLFLFSSIGLSTQYFQANFLLILLVFPKDFFQALPALPCNFLPRPTICSF